MKTVWFIRHGESVSNADLPTIHPAQSELTPKGEAEAEKIVAAFTQKPDLIVVSPFVRARQTAVPTIIHFQPVPVEEWPVYEFTYLHPERYKGTTGSQRRPYAMAYWGRSDPLEKEQGEGESFTELIERIQAMRNRLQERTESFIAVFSHGLFLRAFIWMLLTGVEEATPQNMQRYAYFTQAVQMPNGAILKTQFGEDGRIFFSGFDTAHVHQEEEG